MYARFSRVIVSVLTITALFGGQFISPADAASSYSISYNGNGQTAGTPPVDSLSPYNPNATVTVKENTGNLSKSGYTFAGWNTATNGTGTDYLPGSTFTVKSDLILYAKWTTTTFTVNYDGNGNSGGTPPSSVTQGLNTTFSIAGAGSLVRTGYTFAGWNTTANGSGTSYSVGATYTVTGNATLYAIWTINTYTLSYTAGTGGSVSGSTSQTINYGSNGSTVTAVAASGYTFIGWSDGVLTASRTDSAVTSDLAVTANFAINTFALTYSANTNGVISGNTFQIVSYGNDGLTVTAVPNTGYSFVSWSDGVLTPTRTDLNVTTNISVTANFVINSYALTYVAGAGGSITGNVTQSVNYGADGASVTAVPNTGYSFISWSDGVLTASRTDINVTANISVTATFSINSYSLSYSTGTGGSLLGATFQSVNYGASGAQVTAVPNVGYSFVSWSDGVLTASRTDSSIMSNLSVTAEFAIKTYTLNYSAGSNGSINGSMLQTVNHGSNGSEVTALPEIGYKFVSWSDGIMTPTRSDANVQSDLIVSALFALESTYRLIYVDNVESESIVVPDDDYNYLADSTATISSVIPTRDNYQFTGWNTASDGSGLAIAPGESRTVTANILLYAQWKINTYTLAFNGNGNSSGSVPSDVTQDYNSTLIVPGVGNLSRTGYTFANWNTAQNGSGTSCAAGSIFTLTANSTLYAIWNQIINNNENSGNNGNTNSNNNSNNNVNNNTNSSLGNTIISTPKVVVEEKPSEVVEVPQTPMASTSSKPQTRFVFTSSVGSNVVQLNKTTTLSLSAEGGQAVVVYSTMTPDICSVSPEGVVTGLHGGTCLILASITGSSKDSIITPTVIVLTVEEPASSSLTIKTARQVKNYMTIKRNKGKFLVSLNFISTFKNKTAQLQLGLRNSQGTLKYRSVASLLLNSKGNGKVTRNATYAKKIYFRALVNKKVIVTKKIV